MVLYIDGKKWTGEDIDEGIEESEYLMGNPENSDELLSFTNKRAFRDWYYSKGKLHEYEKLMDAITKAQNIKYPKTPYEEEKIRKKEVQHVMYMNRKLREILKEEKIEPHEIEKVKELHKKYGFLHSAYIFDKTHYRGAWRYLPLGYIRRFKWIRFNDRAESGYVLALGMILFRHSWFRGKKIIIAFNYPRAHFGWFRNRASSSIVF